MEKAVIMREEKFLLQSYRGVNFRYQRSKMGGRKLNFEGLAPGYAEGTSPRWRT
jgi:hypothetical protein